ncbi:hypothetical protein AGDE_16150 [Angomonas deanei]|uniref:Uncharacterized protein n=1 Tax=Angomonas deanei TaxID=59799 RepID=A0A7G2C858_9TRYP|nr:hypothetical protein AGDE_16150 [Angomonas deanei]CAD2216030.1 hypothetical protein, conserved [Angomonas deanei]|eukprot:EPY17630.1 hypothetical protein AGDE_16150 [Angomonas deanei]
MALPEGDQYTTVGKDDRFYLPFDTALQIFREANFPCAEVLHRGPLHSLLQLSPEFLSGVAATLFGLPPLPASYDNKAEGYVVRPVRDVWVCTNTEKQKWSRVIIKMKHPKFSEFAHTKEGGADGEEGTVDLTPFLTTGRVESVLSKYTSDEQGDHARMVQAVLEDAMKDAEKVKR